MRIHIRADSELKVQDDGSGIEYTSLQRVCQRHMTSKIEKGEDIDGLKTYGFRGEALASISQQACVTVITRTKGSESGYEVKYHKNCIVSGPSACSAHPGTSIKVSIRPFSSVSTKDFTD